MKARDLCHVTTVTDHEGNRYNVVAFANTPNFMTSNPDNNKNLLQCWTKENMRAVTSPSTGTYLINSEYSIPEPNSKLTSGKVASWLDNDSVQYAPMNYGVLYNWNAARDIYNRNFPECETSLQTSAKFYPYIDEYPQGICPVGWHVSKPEEWSSLEAYLSTTYSLPENYSGNIYGYSNFIGAVGSNPYVPYLGNTMVAGVWEKNENVGVDRLGNDDCSYRNLSDLSVLPAYVNDDDVISTWAYFWAGGSTTVGYDGNNNLSWLYAPYYQFHSKSSCPKFSFDNKDLQMSVRCVKDYTPKKAVYLMYVLYGTSKLGFATNPIKPVKKRGVIYCDANGSSTSPLLIADPSAEQLQSTNVSATIILDNNAGVDNNFEITIPQSSFDVRGFIIYNDNTVDYSDTY